MGFVGGAALSFCFSRIHRLSLHPGLIWGDPLLGLVLPVRASAASSSFARPPVFGVGG